MSQRILKITVFIATGLVAAFLAISPVPGPIADFPGLQQDIRKLNSKEVT